MEIIYFTVAAIVLYLVSDKILDRIEVHLGRRLENRSLIFFGILATLAISSFTILEALLD